MRMELDQRTHVAASPTVLARAACVLAGALAVAAIAIVIGLRIANEDVEPAGENWWLVALLAVSTTFGPAGAALTSRPGRRLLGTACAIVGVAAALSAISRQYAGYLDAGGGDGRTLVGLAEMREWSRPVMTGVLVGVVPWLLVPAGRRPALLLTAAATATVVGVGAVSTAAGGPTWVADVAAWLVAAAATAGTIRLGHRWWHEPRHPADPLPAWILAGSGAAWLAVVPESLDVAEWTMAGKDVVTALLLLATVPLLLGGAVIDAMRESASPFLGISKGVIEWVLLATGIVGVYTVLVAGLGTFVGGDGPTWFLVATTGAIALVLEPARRHVRRLVDHVVYGARDDPLAAVQRVVDHLGADVGDALLPALVESLRSELRLDAVAIDVRVDGAWHPGAATGTLGAHRRAVPLSHRGEVVGRLVVGWTDGPALRERDTAILDQLVGPLSLAVGWVRLAEDLRRSSVAIVSAREEERRRLRRDLHDGLGPSLTGVSLGLRTALRQLERRADSDPGGTPQLLLTRVADEVDTAVADLKRIVRDLRPTALDQLGLVEAVAEFTRGFGDVLDITLALPAEPLHLPAAVEIATYRIVTEAVTNVVRHAGAARCWLSIEAGTNVVIDVVDDGVGMTVAGAPGVGLAAMRERAAELGGTVQVVPSAPRGTRVHVQLPATLP
jgi:signal transduction histidine kinase